MLNADIRTVVDRQALGVVFKDPRTLLAMEATMKTVQDVPDAVNAAQTTADQAVIDAANAQGDADQALINAAAAQSTANAAGLAATAAQTTANGAQTTADGAVIDAATAQADVDALTTTNRTANTHYSGPASGGSAPAAFRALVVDDLPTPPTFSAHRNGTNQTIASGSFVKLQGTTTEWNVGACYDGVTNYRFTPTQAGKYTFEGAVNIGLPAAGSMILALFKNGAEYKRGPQIYAPLAVNLGATASFTAQANGTTDYFELFLFQSSGSPATLDGTATLSWFQGVFAAR